MRYILSWAPWGFRCMCFLREDVSALIWDAHALPNLQCAKLLILLVWDKHAPAIAAGSSYSTLEKTYSSRSRRLSVLRSIPSASAACVLFPPESLRTRSAYRRVSSSSVG